METTSEESPMTYKRRRSGRPLSELPWNASDVDLDPEPAVSLFSFDDEGVENVTPASRSRKRLSDQPLTRRLTRSCTTPVGESNNLKDTAVKVTGTAIGKKGKDKEKEKGKVVERTPAKDKEQEKGKVVERTPAKDNEQEKGKVVERTPAEDKENVKGKDKEKEKGTVVERTPAKDKENVKGTAIERTPRKEKGTVIERTPAKDEENVKGKAIERTPRKDKGKSVDRTPTPRKQASNESPVGSGPGLWQSPIEFVMEKRAMFKEIDEFELESEEEEPEEQKNTGIQMLSDSSGETISLDSSKGETSVEPPNTRPEKGAQDAISTEELRGETSAQPANTRPEQSTHEVATAETVSRGERPVQTPTTGLGQITEEVTITVEVGEKDGG